MNTWGPRTVAGRQAVGQRARMPSWRGGLGIHTREDGDLATPAGRWPAAQPLVISAIIGHATWPTPRDGPASGDGS